MFRTFALQEAHKKYIEVRQPYNAQHETQRKAALDFLLTRTPTQEIEDQKLLEAAAAIESRRTVDVANVINAAQEGATPMKAGVGGSYEEREDILIAVDGSGPAPPGAYLRGAHTKARIETMLSSIPGGSKTAKLLDKAIESLGVKNLSIPTHAVCDIYVELRKETAAMMELQKEVDMRAEELAILQGRIDPVAKEKERASCCSGVNVANQGDSLRSAGGGNVPQGTLRPEAVFIAFFMLYVLRFPFLVCSCLLASSETTFSSSFGKIAFVAH